MLTFEKVLEVFQAYENKEQSDADTSGHVGPKIRVWGEPQQAAFVPLVATEALLAI